MNRITAIFYWVVLVICINIFAQIGLFSQTLPSMENNSIWNKLLASEFWATIQWIFTVPSMRVGITFLDPAQLLLISYIFGFTAQLVSNYFWLKIPTTLDDYVAICLMILGASISEFRVFG